MIGVLLLTVILKISMIRCGLGLWCLTLLSTIFQLYREISFIGGGNRSTPKKITDLSQVTDKFYHVVLYQAHLAWSGFKLPTLVVIGTDCISSNISNYHTITATGPFSRISITHMSKWVWNNPRLQMSSPFYFR